MTKAAEKGVLKAIGPMVLVPEFRHDVNGDLLRVAKVLRRRGQSVHSVRANCPIQDLAVDLQDFDAWEPLNGCTQAFGRDIQLGIVGPKIVRDTSALDIEARFGDGVEDRRRDQTLEDLELVLHFVFEVDTHGGHGEQDGHCFFVDELADHEDSLIRDCRCEVLLWDGLIVPKNIVRGEEIAIDHASYRRRKGQEGRLRRGESYEWLNGSWR